MNFRTMNHTICERGFWDDNLCHHLLLPERERERTINNRESATMTSHQSPSLLSLLCWPIHTHTQTHTHTHTHTHSHTWVCMCMPVCLSISWKMKLGRMGNASDVAGSASAYMTPDASRQILEARLDVTRDTVRDVIAVMTSHIATHPRCRIWLSVSYSEASYLSHSQ